MGVLFLNPKDAMTTSYDQLRNNCSSILRDLERKQKDLCTKYLEEALDLEFSSNRQGYLGTSLLVALGGPNIWIDTRYNRIEGYWGSDCVILNYEDVNGLHEACAQSFEYLS